MPSLFLKLFQSYDVGLISCNEDLIHSPVAHFNLVKGQIALGLDLLLCFLLVLLLVICGDIVTSLKNQVLWRLVCLLIIGNFLFFLSGSGRYVVEIIAVRRLILISSGSSSLQIGKNRSRYLVSSTDTTLLDKIPDCVRISGWWSTTLSRFLLGIWLVVILLDLDVLQHLFSRQIWIRFHANLTVIVLIAIFL